MALRWRELREAYPRIVTGMLLGIAVLLLTDLVLAYKRVQYGWELARMRAAMTETERRRVDAIAASEENRLAIAVELARREALGDAELHLAVDTENGLLYLERQGARLREMRVRLASGGDRGHAPGRRDPGPAAGQAVGGAGGGRLVSLGGAGVGLRRPRPAGAGRQTDLPGALGPLAVFLDSGAVLYSRPAVGPLSDVSYVLPGSVRAEAPDLEAIREDLQPGMAVYFH